MHNVFHYTGYSFKIKVPQQQLPTYEQCDKQCKDKTTAEIRKNIETQVQRVVQVYKEVRTDFKTSKAYHN